MMLSHQEILIRLVAAAVLGGVVGLERERLDWAAGLRTHMLVSLGACLVMIVSAFGFVDVVHSDGVVLDPSRIAAQVVSGIGFLGAGTILFLRQRIIKGLTTAASLWAVAAVGLAIGGGLYFAAAVTTAMVVATLAWLKPIERRLFNRHPSRRIVVVAERGAVALDQAEAVLVDAQLSIGQITLKRGNDEGKDRMEFMLDRAGRRDAVLAAATRLRDLAGVREVTL